MTELTRKLLALPAKLDAKRIERQIRHLDKALAGEKDAERSLFLHASYQALMWARNPDAFTPPVAQ